MTLFLWCYGGWQLSISCLLQKNKGLVTIHTYYIGVDSGYRSLRFLSQLQVSCQASSFKTTQMIMQCTTTSFNANASLSRRRVARPENSKAKQKLKHSKMMKQPCFQLYCELNHVKPNLPSCYCSSLQQQCLSYSYIRCDRSLVLPLCQAALNIK